MKSMSIAFRGRVAEEDSGGKKKKSDEVSLMRKKSCQDQQQLAAADQQQQQQQQDEKEGPFRSCLHLYRKPLAVNALCLAFLFIYSFLGGFIFLHFEEPNWKMSRAREMADRLQCVRGAIGGVGRAFAGDDFDDAIAPNGILAERIVVRCVLSQARDERMEWNLKNAVLFGFGILTTLGYGKIEPQTTEGRLFTVFYGFLGVPFTVIIFTNFGRYLQRLERCVRKRLWRQWRRISTWRRHGGNKMFGPVMVGQHRKGSWMLPPITVLNEEGRHHSAADDTHGPGERQPDESDTNGTTADRRTVEEAVKLYEADDQESEGAEEEEDEEEDQISPITLIFIVFLYLLLGAMLIDWLDDSVDFPNGIYFAFLCLTAIEYGKLIPTDALYLPLVIGYICFGLAISTIALDIGSTYVKKLYYLGQKIRNIASIKIWFGAKHLRVRELLAALGHNIGLEPTVLCDLDLEQLITSAIQVKEGRLHRVPQTHMIMDGIWPPELVPLFLKDGTFPDWVDADERRKWSVASALVRKRSVRRGSPTSATLAHPFVHKKSSTSGSARSVALASLLLSQPPERTPPLPPVQPDRLSVVRFEEFVRKGDEADDEQRLRLAPVAGDASSLRRKCYYYPLPPMPPTTVTTTAADEAELPDSTTSGINSDPDLSFMDTALPSCWSLSVPSSTAATAGGIGIGAGATPATTNTAQIGGLMAMRRSETVPPLGHPDTSLFYMSNFPSMEMSSRRPPLPPLVPLPTFTEEEEQEEEEREDDGTGIFREIELTKII